MNVYVLNRRNIVFRSEGAGMVHVLLVPGREQIQVVRDIAGMGDVSLAEAGPAGKGLKMPALSRGYLGKRYIYGHLVEEIVELKQSVRVWLAEDFVDHTCQAFFFIFSPTVMIHGIRESDDEGQVAWRTAQLPIQSDGYATLLSAVSDYAISYSTEGLVVAVYNQLDLYKNLQTDLEPYGIHPVPLTTLKPPAMLKPLYRHYDFTLIYVTLLLFGAIALLSSAVYLTYTLLNRGKLETQIAQIQQEIQQIQLNQNISQIRDPQAVLRAMARSGEIEPSAIIDAAAAIAEPLGTLTTVTYQPPVLKEGEALPDVQTVMLAITGLKDKLLLDQETKAQGALGGRPWVRSLQRVGANGDDGQIEVTLQVGGERKMAHAVTSVSETSPTRGIVVPHTAIVPEASQRTAPIYRAVQEE